MARAHAHRNTLLPDRHLAQPVHEADAHQAVRGPHVLCDLQQGFEGEGRVGGVGEGGDGAGGEGVARGAEEEDVGAGGGGADG